jgi:hypothetical protein
VRCWVKERGERGRRWQVYVERRAREIDDRGGAAGTSELLIWVYASDANECGSAGLAESEASGERGMVAAEALIDGHSA